MIGSQLIQILFTLLVTLVEPQEIQKGQWFHTKTYVVWSKHPKPKLTLQIKIIIFPICLCLM